jgi:hypothetical protein
MSGEGMKMLVEHLKEFKDSTSREIEDLGSKIKVLRAQHEAMSEEVEEREAQIEEHDRVVGNLQSVNSRKYRAEERGDWQTLVESLNQDREYLSKDLADINAATTSLTAEVRRVVRGWVGGSRHEARRFGGVGGGSDAYPCNAGCFLVPSERVHSRAANREFAAVRSGVCVCVCDVLFSSFCCCSCSCSSAAALLLMKVVSMPRVRVLV